MPVGGGGPVAGWPPKQGTAKPPRRGVGRAPRLGAASVASPPAKIRAIREIRGKNRGMKHEKLTGEILGAAMAVLNELKPGLDERLYENALVIEPEHHGAGSGLTAQLQGGQAGVETGGAGARRSRNWKLTTDDTDFTDRAGRSGARGQIPGWRPIINPRSGHGGIAEPITPAPPRRTPTPERFMPRRAEAEPR